MKKNAHETAIKNIKIIGFFTSISRVLGYIRSMTIAAAFGTGIIADAFFVAFRIPNALRKLLGEGALSAAFIPVFSDLLINKDKEEAFVFANKLISCLGIILIFFTCITYAFAPWIIRILAPGFALSTDKLALTTLLLRYLFPYIIFMAFTALAMGILNSFKNFAIPAFSPILFNISFIFSIFFISPRLSEPVYGIIIGILAGGMLQLLIHVIALKKYDFKFNFDPDFKHPLIKKIGRLIIPAIFSLAITEINILVNNIIASYESFVGKGAISALFYANFLVQLPLAIFATSVATAFFPDMAENASRQDFKALHNSLSNALRISLFIILPACVGLITLAYPITRILYEHGKFTAHSTQQTASALIAYSIGLFAYAGVKITVPVFYSLHDTKTPMRIGGVAVIFNLFLCIGLAMILKHTGLALATSLSAFLNLALLFYFLEKKIGKIERKILFKSSSLIIIISFLMGIIVTIVFKTLSLYLSNQFIYQVIILGTSISVGLISYFGFAYLLKMQELTWLMQRSKN